MWRRAPPLLLMFALFVGLGPPVGGLAAFLLMPLDEGLGNDGPGDVATIMAWGAYIVGLPPALATATAAAMAWLIRAGPVAYFAACCVAGAVSAAVMVIPLIALGTLESGREVRELVVFMAACGGLAAVLPALATLPAGRRAPEV